MGDSPINGEAITRLFAVHLLNFENYRSCSIRATDNRFVFSFIRPFIIEPPCKPV